MNRIRSVLLLAICALSISRIAPAQVRLTNIVSEGTDSAGNYIGGYDWHTTTLLSGAWYLWVIQGDNLNGAFINSPGLDVPLDPGTYTFTLYATHNKPDVGHYSLNLAFNGQFRPSICVYAPTQTSIVAPAFVANPASSRLRWDDAIVPSSGAASTVIANRRITVTDFRYTATGLYNVDRVAPYSTSPDGRLDNVGQFTLLVEPATEPPYDVEAGFALSPTNGVWQYGWKPSPLAGEFYPHSNGGATPSGLDVLISANNSHLNYNGSGRTIALNLTQRSTWYPGEMSLHPGQNGEASTIRWTCSSAGRYVFYAEFWRIDAANTNPTVVLNNTTVLWSAAIRSATPRAEYATPTTVQLNAGDTLDFCVGGQYASGNTGTRAVITPVGDNAQVWIAHGDGSPASNPNGVWQYGRLPGSTFERYGDTAWLGTLAFWRRYPSEVATVFNTAYYPFWLNPTDPIFFPERSLQIHPESDGTPMTVRFTAPVKGLYRADTHFTTRNWGVGTTTRVGVATGGSPIWNDFIWKPNGENHKRFNSPTGYPIALNAGQSIDFFVSNGGNGYFSDSTGVWPFVQRQKNATSPSTTASLSGNQGSSGWYVGPVQVTLSSMDDMPGVASTMYRVDGGDWQTYSGPFTLSDDGRHTVGYLSTDLDGNAEAERSVTVNIDSKPPTVTPADLIDPTWRNTSLSQEFTSSDSLSGLASPADAAFTLTASAESPDKNTPTVVSRSVSDVAGNFILRKVSAFIDLSAPLTSPAIGGSIPKGGGDGFAGSATIDMTMTNDVFSRVTEKLSGLAATYYSIVKGFKTSVPGNLTFSTYAQPIVWSTVGDFTVFYYSKDNAGNVEQVRWRTFSVKNK